MIQAVAQPKHIEPKTLSSVKGKVSSEEALLEDPESALENLDFANELLASLGEAEVKAVEVSPEQSLQNPSSLIKNFPETGQTETVTPSVFDPAMTKNVDQLIGPKSTEAKMPLTDKQVMELAQGNIPVQVEGEGEVKADALQALLKTPQVGGRSPALDFAQSEIDPKLMNMEDFVAQKNAVAKKTSGMNPYGMGKAQVQKMALETDLKQTQVVQDASALQGKASEPMNSQQFILNMMNGDQGSPKVNESQVPMKVFDMNHIKSSDTNTVMNQISDYIVQAKAAKEPTVNMRVNHEELGMIDITVQKTGLMNHESIAINIGTHTADGKNFFQQNSKELFSHLTQSGLNVSDMKIETPSQTAKNDFDLGQQPKNQGGQEKQFGSEQNQRRHDSDKRQNLWDLLKDKEAA